jgi:hypothetical protein
MKTNQSIDTAKLGIGSLQLLLTVFSEPKTAFKELRERPSFWFPMLLFVIATAAAIVAYFQRVDMAWFNDYLASSDPRMAKAGERVPIMSRDMMMWTSLTAVVIGVPIMRMVEGAYYFLGDKVINLDLGFRHWLALACWSSMPLLLSLVASVVMLALHPSGQVSQEQLNVLSLNELFFLVKPASKWHTLASTLTLLHPWVWGLVVVAVRTWTGRSWAFSLGFALLPWLVFYGLWASVVAI